MVKMYFVWGPITSAKCFQNKMTVSDFLEHAPGFDRSHLLLTAITTTVSLFSIFELHLSLSCFPGYSIWNMIDLYGALLAVEPDFHRYPVYGLVLLTAGGNSTGKCILRLSRLLFLYLFGFDSETWEVYSTWNFFPNSISVGHICSLSSYSGRCWSSISWIVMNSSGLSLRRYWTIYIPNCSLFSKRAPSSSRHQS